jgi:hypothetical protein
MVLSKRTSRFVIMTAAAAIITAPIATWMRGRRTPSQSAMRRPPIISAYRTIEEPSE